MWEGNPGYQLDVAIAVHEYVYAYVCVCAGCWWPWAQCSALQQPPSGAGFRANVEVTPIEGRCQGNDANAAGGLGLRASSLGRKCSLQQPAAAACSGSVCLGGHWTAEPFSKWPSNWWPWTQPVHWLLQPRADGGATGGVAQEGKRREGLGWTFMARVRTQIECQQIPI